MNKQIVGNYNNAKGSVALKKNSVAGKMMLFFSLFFFCFSFSNAQSIGKLWGMTYAGGDSGGGVIFNYDALISHDSIVHPFPTSGTNPNYTNLIQGTDGNLYGMTQDGGASGYGTVFKCSTSGAMTLLHSFAGGASDGQYPLGSLIQGSDGNLYGMTFNGGPSGNGTVFKCTTTGTVTLLHGFAGGVSDGEYPLGSLVQGGDGNLYGMTNLGGASGDGTLFKCSTTGTVTLLYSFTGGTSDGSDPQGNLIEGSDGNLYGMTPYGGASGYGILFQCSTSGAMTLLHSFAGGVSDGQSPYGSLIQGSDGNLYGMTYQGGSSNDGTLFKCSTTGTLTLLHSFAAGVSDGQYPYGSLIQGGDGNLYGMTQNGGVSGDGILFQCSTTGTINLLHSFSGGTSDGYNPLGSLIQGSDGNLYGVTYQGGALGYGIIFKCSTTGTETLLFTFGVTSIGYYQYGSLIQCNDGNLYGMTYQGGSSGVGTIFKCSSTGAVTILHNFAGGISDGKRPYGNLIQGSDGNLYGMTQYGGSSDDGTLFTCSMAGVVTLLHSFSGGASDGQGPMGSLVQGSDGNLYGMTQAGGASNYGTLFTCSTGGTLTLLHSFTGGTSDGSGPQGSLIQGSDGNLYGMTPAGGVSGNGTLFTCSTTGTLTLLHSFSGGASDGESPYGSLIQCSDGNLYGMTYQGGLSNKGILFICSTTGTMTLLHSFAGGSSDGESPYGSLIQGSDGNLYGMTQGGGASDDGILFKCSTSGTETILEDLNGIVTGSSPSGNLFEAMSTSVQVGCKTLTAAVRGPGSPFSYQWSTGSTSSNITVSTSGTYSVTVTNSTGITVSASTTVTYNPISLTAGNDSAVCNGASAGLSVSCNGGTGGITFTWMPDTLKGETASVVPSTTTTYTVTATDVNNCTAKAEQVITVNEVPAITTQPFPGGQGGCPGFSATPIFVTATGSGLGYQWYSNTAKSTVGGTLIAGATSSSYTPVTTTAGRLYYYCIVSGTCAPELSSKVSGVVLVNPDTPATPGAILGSASQCGGLSSQIYGVPPVANTDSYNWTVPTGWTITANDGTDSITVTTGAASDNGTVTVTAGNSCGTSAASSLTVTVNAPTTDTLIETACSSYTLNSSTYTSSGTYTQNLSNRGGCDSTLTLILTIKPLPTLSIRGKSNLSIGSTDTLTASGGISYIWTSGSTSDTTIVKPFNNTVYIVTGKDSSGCVNTDSITVTLETTGIRTISNSNSTTLYPNPSVDRINLSFEMQESEKAAVIEIIDVSGKELMLQNTLIGRNKNLSLDVSTLTPGVYFIKVTTPDYSQVLKFVKQ